MTQKVDIEEDWLVIDGNDAIHLATVVQVKWLSMTQYQRENNPTLWQYIQVLSDCAHVDASIYYTESETSLLKADMKKIREAAQRVRRTHVGRVGKGSW